MNCSRRKCGHATALAVLVVFTLALRISSPSDIFDNDQAGPISHIADVAFNGHWLMQQAPTRKLATKPPMYPWMGALAVRATGLTHEWTFKLPQILAFVMVTLVVFDWTRRVSNVPVATVAAAVWVANYHVFKLMYTARTDMLLAMWITLGVWSVQRQRDEWQVGPEGAKPARAQPGLIFLFALAIAGGVLTKGPPGLIPVAWLIGVIGYDRAWRRCRPMGQLLGILLAVALPLAWVLPTLQAYPEWARNINVEVVERITGAGSGAHRRSSVFSIPGYFLARFAPWSVLFAAAAARAWSERRESKSSVPSWPLWWVILILVIFMIPRGKRADYILPAYPAAAILVATIVAIGQSRPGWHRSVVHLVLGGVAIAGIAAAVACPWIPRPPLVPLQPGSPIAAAITSPTVLMFGCGAAALVAAVFALCLVIREKYVPASMSCCFVLIAILGIYQSTLSRAAKTRRGDAIIALAETAHTLSRREGMTVFCHHTGSSPIQALLGVHQLDEERMPEIAPSGALLITDEQAWQGGADQFPERASIIMQTQSEDPSDKSLLLVRISPAHRVIGDQ